MRPTGNSHRVAARGVVFVIGWLGLMVSGFVFLARYEGAPGRPANAPVHNDRFRSDRFSLVMALHPKCPCSRATVGELEKISSRAPQKFSITVLAFKPRSEPETWIQSATVERVTKLGAVVRVDSDGLEAEKLGLTTSGQILLYSPDGTLIYNGGITSARGHSGDNLGEESVLNLVNKAPAAVSAAPVFGCPLSDRVP